MDLAKKVGNLFIRKIKENKWIGSKEFHIGDENSNFTTIKMLSDGDIIKIIFKKNRTGAYFVFSNNYIESCSDINHFERDLYYLNRFGEDFIEKLLKVELRTIENHKQVNKRYKTEEQKNEQVDRLLDKYNHYGKKFEETNDKKFLHKRNKIINFLKNRK